MINSSFFADPTRTHFVRSAHDWVRICRDAVGERLAQQDILQAESVQIFAVGEIPVRVTQERCYFSQAQYHKSTDAVASVLLHIACPYEKSRPISVFTARLGCPYPQTPHPSHICREWQARGGTTYHE